MKILLTVSSILLCSLTAIADVRLPDVLGDAMVVQQKQKVPVWGTADAGEAVAVTFGKQKKTAVADADGKWRVDLSPMNANATPQVMTIVGKNKIELKDILVGEVWLVSGQSNMQWTLMQSNNGEAEVAKATHPNIRLFNVSREVAFKRKTGALGIWAACTPQSVKDFSGIGYYFAVELQKDLKVPVGIINSSYGGSQAEAWTPVRYLISYPQLATTVERTKIWEAERPKVKEDYAAAIAKWRDDSEKAKAAGARPSPSPSVPDALRDYRVASSIYDGMIEPLMPFAIKGAVWYQGESNEARAYQYNFLLPVMMRAWRDGWEQRKMPFGIVQLPNYRAVKAEPEESNWSFLREAQRKTFMSDPTTGLIVTIDVGEASDIHPRNKIDVGWRVSQWALADVYGRKIVSGGPVYDRSEIKAKKVILSFKNAGAGLKTKSGENLSEFSIAGQDGKWHWAEAKITAKNKIEVWSEQVPRPLAVRYAFNSNPKTPNLTNSSGIPASPFRTDNWADPTEGKW